MRKNETKRYICDKCGAEFQSGNALGGHKSTAHRKHPRIRITNKSRKKKKSESRRHDSRVQAQVNQAAQQRQYEAKREEPTFKVLHQTNPNARQRRRTNMMYDELRGEIGLVLQLYAFTVEDIARECDIPAAALDDWLNGRMSANTHVDVGSIVEEWFLRLSETMLAGRPDTGSHANGRNKLSGYGQLLQSQSETGMVFGGGFEERCNNKLFPLTCETKVDGFPIEDRLLFDSSAMDVDEFVNTYVHDMEFPAKIRNKVTKEERERLMDVDDGKEVENPQTSMSRRKTIDVRTDELVSELKRSICEQFGRKIKYYGQYDDDSRSKKKKHQADAPLAAAAPSSSLMNGNGNAPEDRFAMFTDVKPAHCIKIDLKLTMGDVRYVDSFLWDINDPYNNPEEFATTLCGDLGLHRKFAPEIAHSIRSQVYDRRIHLRSRAVQNVKNEFENRPLFRSKSGQPGDDWGLWEPRILIHQSVDV